MKSIVSSSFVALAFIIIAVILRIYVGLLITPAVQQANVHQGNQPTLTIRIADPEGEFALQGSDMIAHHEGIPPHLHVVIENVSPIPQSIFDEWNSWGYGTLTLEYQMPGDKIRTMVKYPSAWDMNFPSWTTLRPGEVLVRDVYLDRKIWDNIPNINDPNQYTSVPITFRAIFTQDEKSAAAWRGSIQSPFIQIRLAERR